MRRIIPVALVTLAIAFPCAAPAEIIDRVAAVVGRRMITGSEVQREGRLEAYFDGQPPAGPLSDQSPEYREILERLIEQRLIQYEMDQSRFPEADEAAAKEWLKKLRPRANPADYGLREADLIEYGKRLARTDQFLELRFNRPVLLPAPPRPGSPSSPNQAQNQQNVNEEEHEIDHWLKDLRARLGVRILERETP